MAILFDTETTGLLEASASSILRQPRITQLCAIKLDDNTLEEVGRFASYFDPSPTIVSAEAVKVSGLTMDFLKGQPTFASKYNELVDFFFGERILVGHNLSFDRDILVYELARLASQFKFPYPRTHICTVEATEHLKGYRLKLVDLYEDLFGERFKDAHNAIADTEALARCYVELKKRNII